jgi:Ca2+-binding RTX toxin-like protein
MATIIGTTGNDTLIDLSGVDDTIWGDLQGTLLGLGGNDKIYGRAGNDFIYGDAEIIGPSGRGGNDDISGGDGADRIFGDASGTLYGSGGDDVLHQNGGAGDLVGDANLLAAGARGGNDRLYGAGTLVGDSYDTIFSSAFGGHDLLDASSATVSSLLMGDASGNLVGASVGGDDKLIGSVLGDLLLGEGGGEISGSSRGGNDRLMANGGDDSLYGDAAILRDFARGGQDLLRGGSGNDQLYGDGIELRGNAVGGNDQLYGGSGNDQLWGDGDIVGDAVGGRDRFFFSDSFGDDTINDFRQGEDRLVFIGYQPDELQITVVGSDTVLTTLGDDSVTLTDFTGALTYGTDVIFA